MNAEAHGVASVEGGVHAKAWQQESEFFISAGLLSVHVTWAATITSVLVTIFHAQQRLLLGYDAYNYENPRVMIYLWHLHLTLFCAYSKHTAKKKKREKGNILQTMCRW